MRNVFGILALCMMLTACGRATGIQADYCATVAVHGKADDAALAAMFDAFATREGLSIDRSNPAARVYEGDRGWPHLSVSFRMGDFGAVVAFFQRSPEPVAMIGDRLERFMAEVGGSYDVTPCSEIAGFRNPVLYK